MAFSVDISNPADNSLVSAFPSNERTHRSNFRSMFIVEHEEASARHIIPNGTIAARDAITDWPNGALWLRNSATLFPGIQQRRAGAWADVLPYGVGTTAARDALTTVPTGALWGNIDRGVMERYDGAAWQTMIGYGVGNAAARAAFATPYTNMLWFETDTRSTYYYTGGAWTLFGVSGIASSVSLLGGTQAGRPTAADLGSGNFYGNTDDRVLQRSDGAAFLDMFPPLLMQKAESTFGGTSYGAAYAYVQNSAGSADLSVAVATPARGTWMIQVFANVVAAGPGGSKAVLQCEIHEDGVFNGTRGGTGFPDIPSQNVAASAFHVKTNPTAGVTYTFKVRAASQQNNSQSVAAGIYTALVKTA